MHADTETYNTAQAPGDRAICQALATEIDRALPDAENKVWHAHPVWFLDGNPIVGYSKLKTCIRLLFWSGGNPQIPKADGDAPVQAYIAAMPGWKREAGRRLDALIERTVPNVQKAVRWNSPFYGVEGRG